MTSFLFALFMFMIALGLLITVHEYGHFLIARCFRVKVLRFSIGFGRPLLCYRGKKGTDYVLAVFPFGGYVKMLDEAEGQLAPEALPYAFNRQSVWVRMAIVLAGPLFNLLFAVLALWLMFMMGITTLAPIVGEVIPGSLAEQAGFQAKQKIIAVSGKATPNWQAVQLALVSHQSEEKDIALQVKDINTGEETRLWVNLSHWKISGERRGVLANFGITPSLPTTEKEAAVGHYLYQQQYSAWPALGIALTQTATLSWVSLEMVGKMLTGKISLRTLSGPIGIAQVAGQSASVGFVYFLSFLALVSVSLAVLNILPIPMLDGGHLLYCIIEVIRGRPVSNKIRMLGFKVGIFIVVMLMAIAIGNDLARIFG